MPKRGASPIDPERLRATVAHLSSFPTRNSNTPEYLAAVQWLKAQYAAIDGLKVQLFEFDLPAGPRVPQVKTIPQVVATLPGEIEDRVMISAHLDSYNLQGIEMPAPGANDNISGIALTLELARILSTQKWRHSLTFIAFGGEEQGLVGSRALAQYAREQEWRITGLLNNDMVGSSSNLLGQFADRTVRCFSPSDAKRNESREMARLMEWLVASKTTFDEPFFAPHHLRHRHHQSSFHVKLVLRHDRFGRGGDHTPFNEVGFPALRLTERCEEYTRQHTLDDVITAMDFDYLAGVAGVNLLTASALAQSQPAPTDVKILRNQSHHTTLQWQGDPTNTYATYWRETNVAEWQHCQHVTGLETTLEKTSKDDYIFAVGAVGGIPVEAS